MGKITSLEECFDVSKINSPLSKLENLKELLEEEKSKLNSNTEYFGKKAFYCKGKVKHITISEKVEEIISTINKTEQDIYQTIMSIRVAAWTKRVSDLNEYIDYCNKKVIEKKQVITDLGSNMGSDKELYQEKIKHARAVHEGWVDKKKIAEEELSFASRTLMGLDRRNI